MFLYALALLSPLPADTLRGCHVHRRATVLAGGYIGLRFGKAMGRGSLGMTAGTVSTDHGAICSWFAINLPAESAA
jgi:hypothetical protein